MMKHETGGALMMDAATAELERLLNAYRDAVEATNKTPALYFEELAAREKIKAAWRALQEEELQIAWAAGNKENDQKNALGRELEGAKVEIERLRTQLATSCRQTEIMTDAHNTLAQRLDKAICRCHCPHCQWCEKKKS